MTHQPDTVYTILRKLLVGVRTQNTIFTEVKISASVICYLYLTSSVTKVSNVTDMITIQLSGSTHVIVSLEFVIVWK